MNNNTNNFLFLLIEFFINFNIFHLKKRVYFNIDIETNLNESTKTLI